MFNGPSICDVTVPAAADLSSSIYRFVVIDSNGRATVATDGTVPIFGILQNKPSAQDQEARIRIMGQSLLQYAGAVTAGNLVGTNAQGFGTASPASGQYAGAQAMVGAGGSGDYQTVTLARMKL